MTLPGVARADCADPFGKPGEILDFHLNITRADWAALVASRVPSTDGNRGACDAVYPEFPAQFRCGETGPWLKVAVRKKRGEERGVEAPQKPPLKIDFNETFMGKVPEAMGQRWPAGFGDLGYRKITLNNGQGNKAPGRTLMLPNLLSEHVALRLLRREVPHTPGTAIAAVTLHLDGEATGEFHGGYLLIEDIDKTALRRRFGRGDGRLLKASKAGCPSEIQFDDGPPNESKAAFDAFMAKGPGAGMAEAEKSFDLDATLRQEAVREILVNGDDTLFFAGGEGNNYYAYDPRQGKRRYMPWDVDLTFGQQQQNCAPLSLKCPATFPILTWCGRNRSRLGNATACNPEIQKRYLAIMCQLTQGSLSADEIIKVWDEADKVARPAVAREKDLIWRGMDPLSTAVDKSYGAEYLRLRAWIPERIKSVQAQITAKGLACAPGCPAGATEPCEYLTCPGERRCENNLWTTCQPKANCALPTPGSGGGDAGAPPASDAGSSGPTGTGGTGGSTTPPNASDAADAGPVVAPGNGQPPPPGQMGTGGSPAHDPTPRPPAPAPAGEASMRSGCSYTPGTTASGPCLLLMALALVTLAVRTKRRRERAL